MARDGVLFDAPARVAAVLEVALREVLETGSTWSWMPCKRRHGRVVDRPRATRSELRVSPVYVSRRFFVAIGPRFTAKRMGRFLGLVRLPCPPLQRHAVMRVSSCRSDFACSDFPRSISSTTAQVEHGSS